MRRVRYYVARGVAVLSVVGLLSLQVSARPREERPVREPREKRDPIVRIIKKVIQSLGDGIHIPTP